MFASLWFNFIWFNCNNERIDPFFFGNDSSIKISMMIDFISLAIIVLIEEEESEKLLMREKNIFVESQIASFWFAK